MFRAVVAVTVLATVAAADNALGENPSPSDRSLPYEVDTDAIHELNKDGEAPVTLSVCADTNNRQAVEIHNIISDPGAPAATLQRGKCFVVNYIHTGVKRVAPATEPEGINYLEEPIVWVNVH